MRRGDFRGTEPHLFIFLFILRARPPNKLLHWLCISKCIDLASYWDISNCWLYFISIKLSYHILIFENMGVFAAGSHPKCRRGYTWSPLVNILRNHRWGCALKYCFRGMDRLVSLIKDRLTITRRCENPNPPLKRTPEHCCQLTTGNLGVEEFILPLRKISKMGSGALIWTFE